MTNENIAINDAERIVLATFDRVSLRCAEWEMIEIVTELRRVLRDTYRAGRREQRAEDAPLMKKRPTQAERRTAMVIASRVGKLQK